MAYQEADYGYEAQARRRKMEQQEEEDARHRLPAVSVSDVITDAEKPTESLSALPSYIGRLFGRTPTLPDAPPVKLKQFREQKLQMALDSHSPMAPTPASGTGAPTTPTHNTPPVQESPAIDEREERMQIEMKQKATALMKQVVGACERGDIEGLKRIWNEADIKPALNDGSLTQPKSQEFLPLAAAIHSRTRGGAECVKFLLEQGADPNAKDGSGRPAWHAVLRHCDIGMTKTMFDAGANPNALNSTGGNALHGCVEYGTPAMITLLREHGTELSHKDNFKKSPIELLKDVPTRSADQALRQDARLNAMTQPLNRTHKLS